MNNASTIAEQTKTVIPLVQKQATTVFTGAEVGKCFNKV